MFYPWFGFKADIFLLTTFLSKILTLKSLSPYCEVILTFKDS